MNQRIQQFLEYLTADRGYSPATVQTYLGSLQGFCAYVRGKDETMGWDAVDADLIRGWMAERMDGQAQARTVKRDLSALRSFYRYLMQLHVVDRNPTRLVQNPKAGKTLPTFVKQSEMDRLLDHTAFPETIEGIRDHLILLTFYSTGLRVSELVGLNVGHLHLSVAELKVTGKRNKQRIVPFGLELTRELQNYLSAREANGEVLEADTPLYVDVKGCRITIPAVRQIVKYYLSQVTTQQKRTPHVLRHTFATVMLNNGADLGAVKELLGHESLATTEIYTHTSFAELRKEYEKAHPRGDEM